MGILTTMPLSFFFYTHLKRPKKSLDVYPYLIASCRPAAEFALLRSTALAQPRKQPRTQTVGADRLPVTVNADRIDIVNVNLLDIGGVDRLDIARWNLSLLLIAWIS